MITCKSGVVIMPLAPAGVRILEAIKQAAKTVGVQIVITSGRDGVHSGPSDPHKLGEAFDLRTHGYTDEEKRDLLTQIMLSLQTEDPQDAPIETAGGLATKRFFGFLEDAGGPNEHLHIQRRNNTVYTLDDYLAA